MKLALINPGKTGTNTAIPLGLAYMAGYARAKGHEVFVKDMEVQPDGLERFLSERRPDVVGVSVLTYPYLMAQNIIKTIRATLPNALIVMGGAHISSVGEEALQDTPEADLAVLGEGEATILEILEGKQPSEILGLCYRDNGRVVMNPPRPQIKNLDELPLPAWDLFPVLDYRINLPYGRTKYFMTLNTSRGCPFRCAYCSQPFGYTYRGLSPERVLEQVEDIVRRYRIKEVHFYDDTFTINMKRASKICDLLIESKIKLRWSCTTRVELVNPELLRKMKAAGCWLVALGVESGNQAILDSIEKGYTLEEVRNAFKWAKEAGLRRSAFFMLGLPGETRDTIQQSVDLARELKPDYIAWSITVVLPGTHIREIFKKTAKRIYAAPADALVWRPLRWNNRYVEFAEENLTHRELTAELDRISKMFYLNPRFMIREFLRIRTAREFVQVFGTGFKIIRTLLGFRRDKSN